MDAAEKADSVVAVLPESSDKVKRASDDCQPATRPRFRQCWVLDERVLVDIVSSHLRGTAISGSACRRQPGALTTQRYRSALFGIPLRLFAQQLGDLRSRLFDSVQIEFDADHIANGS